MRKTSIAFTSAMLVCHFLWAQFPADTVFTHAEIMPCFPGCGSLEPGSLTHRQCSDRALVQFISRHLVYPEEAKATGTEGTVYVNFVVDETGRVQSPRLLLDIGGGCGEAALKVLEAMPGWEPGLHEGQPVRVKLNLPIQFSLRNAEKDLTERFTITWGDIVGDSVTVQSLRRNLPFPVYVRGPEGDSRYVDELAFTFARNKRQLTASSRGGISDDLVAVVEKARNGGTFTITASVQDNGRFLYVTRIFQLVE
ncbi:MAG: TonB family protein [Bacteroidetes bacterium]|nr:TonB family protein [Bacteroidota bacterium]